MFVKEIDSEHNWKTPPSAVKINHEGGVCLGRDKKTDALTEHCKPHKNINDLFCLKKHMNCRTEHIKSGRQIKKFSKDSKETRTHKERVK